MFSTGHLLWIGISFALIIFGLIACFRYKPTLWRLFSFCLPLGAISEVIKVFSVTEIVPLVDPVITTENGQAVLGWEPIGQYVPYLAKEHLPLELCSLYLLFMLLALLIRDDVWKKRLYALMFTSGTIGGLMGIVMASITQYFDTASSYFSSPRVWQYFLFHAMIVTLSIYLGFCDESGLQFSDWKKAVIAIIILDVPSYYMNSALASEVYVHDKVVGVTHYMNFFSSYVNPLGLVLTEKWQWLAYLAVRLCIALVFILILYSTLLVKKKCVKWDGSK